VLGGEACFAGELSIVALGSGWVTIGRAGGPTHDKPNVTLGGRNLMQLQGKSGQFVLSWQCPLPLRGIGRPSDQDAEGWVALTGFPSREGGVEERASER
jgi:hypothetical protein